MVYGMPKHMVGVSKTEGGSSSENIRKRTVYILRAKPGACGLCQAINGVPYDNTPVTHPNCKCTVGKSVVEVPAGNDREKAKELLERQPQTQAEIDQWLEDLSRIDFDELDEKTREKIIRRLEEYEDDPSILSRIGVGVSESISSTIQKERRKRGWLPPPPKFFGGGIRG